MHPYINTAIKAARAASQGILRAYDNHSAIHIDLKGKHDYVTSADRDAEQCIVDILHEAYPRHNFITEEQGELTYGDENEVTWVIDPIDGTTNFIHRLPGFVISIAAQKQGKLEHGVIYHPITDELFTASRGGGAQLNGNRIRINTATKLDDTILSLGIPRDTASLEQYCHCLKQLQGSIAGIRRSGATALDLAYLAAGRIDGIWANDQKPWDMAAGILLIREAGGIVTDMDGGDDVFQKGNLVAANSKLIRPLLRLLRDNAITT